MRKALLRSLLVAVAIGGSATTVSAAILEMAPVTGLFTDTQNRAGNAVDGAGTSTIDWGPISRGDRNSSYDFTGETVSRDAPGRFLLGTFTHHNGIIRRTDQTLVSTGLDISMSGTLAGESFNVDRTIDIDHTETHNQAQPCQLGGSGDCQDGVGLSAFDPFNLEVEVGDTRYTLSIAGLFDSLFGTSPITNLITPETEDRQIYLVGALTSTTVLGEVEEPPTEPPAIVPLPASGVLLAAMIAAGGLLGYRRRG